MNNRPLIAHVLYRFDVGGMEQIAVSIINGTGDRYRHVVICLERLGAMGSRIEDAAVRCVSLGKKPGKDWGCYWRLWRALRRLQPDLVQTYNIGTVDAAPIAWLAGAWRVVHAEHGRDAADPAGSNHTYRRLRRWLQPFIARYVAVSDDLRRWLVDSVGIRESRVAYIANGIDIGKFDAARARPAARELLGEFVPAGAVLIVNVARLDSVKDQASLISAFKLVQDAARVGNIEVRLAIAGEGPQLRELQHLIEQLGLARSVHLLGIREDVPELLAAADVFALSSIAEGMPVTLLEAMAARLPVVSTNVGGVASVVESGVTGTLVPASDTQALADAVSAYVADKALCRAHGDAGYFRVATQFSLGAMVSAYVTLYDGVLARGTSAPQRGAVQTMTRRGEH